MPKSFIVKIVELHDGSLAAIIDSKGEYWATLEEISTSYPFAIFKLQGNWVHRRLIGERSWHEVAPGDYMRLEK